MNLHHLLLLLCVLIFTWKDAQAAGSSVVVVIDTDSTGLTEREPGDVVVSRCTVLSIPSLAVIDRLDMGEDVAGAFINKNTLVLTSQPKGPLRRETYNTRQDFAYYAIKPFGRLTQISLPGFLPDNNALYPCTETNLKGGESMAFAVLQYHKNAATSGADEAQAVLGLTSTKRIGFAYTIPAAERFLTRIQPLAGGYLLLHVEHSGGNIESVLKLLDIKSGCIVSTLPVTHVRDVLPSVTPSGACFAVLDRPGIDDSQRLALITRAGNELKIDSVEMPIKFNPRKENTWHGVAISGNNVLLSVGPLDGINDIYLVDFKKQTAEQIFAFRSPPINFTVTADGRYLITVSSKEPQVSLYDLATGKLVRTQEKVSLRPFELIAD